MAIFGQIFGIFSKSFAKCLPKISSIAVRMMSAYISFGDYMFEKNIVLINMVPTTKWTLKKLKKVQRVLTFTTLYFISHGHDVNQI